MLSENVRKPEVSYIWKNHKENLSEVEHYHSWDLSKYLIILILIISFFPSSMYYCCQGLKPTFPLKSKNFNICKYVSKRLFTSLTSCMKVSFSLSSGDKIPESNFFITLSLLWSNIIWLLAKIIMKINLKNFGTDFERAPYLL